MAVLASGLRIVADYVDGFQSTDMVKAKKAQDEQAAKDRVNAELAKGDGQAVSKEIAP